MARDFAVAAVLVHLRYTHASYRGRFKNIVARYMEHKCEEFLPTNLCPLLSQGERKS